MSDENEKVIPKDINIFYLEDEPLFAEKMVREMKSMGFTNDIMLAENLKDAVKILSYKKFDIIFSDWNLPDGKGIDLLKLIRDDGRHDDAAFIMVTTVDDVENVLDAASSGADDYIIKPWESSEVRQKLTDSYFKKR